MAEPIKPPYKLGIIEDVPGEKYYIIGGSCLWFGRIPATDERMEKTAELLVGLANSQPELLAACKAAVVAFDDLFGQCCSNPIKNAWGESINTTKLNEMNTLARAAIDAAEKMATKAG